MEIKKTANRWCHKLISLEFFYFLLLEKEFFLEMYGLLVSQVRVERCAHINTGAKIEFTKNFWRKLLGHRG